MQRSSDSNTGRIGGALVLDESSSTDCTRPVVPVVIRYFTVATKYAVRASGLNSSLQRGTLNATVAGALAGEPVTAVTSATASGICENILRCSLRAGSSTPNVRLTRDPSGAALALQ